MPIISSFNDTVELATEAWASNYTLADDRWRLRQLHGLYQLVLQNRDTLVSDLAKEQSLPAVAYEKEISFFVQGINNHILNLSKQSSIVRWSSIHLGETIITRRAMGVVLIIVDSPNIIRYGLAPLAAAIAANNVAILAISSEFQPSASISCLQQNWSTFIDSNSIFLLPTFDLTDVELGRIDQVAIFGRSYDKYSTILQTAKARFYSSASELNLAIIDEGKKDWANIAEEILRNSGDSLLQEDRFSVAFILEDDVDQFHRSLIALQDVKPPSKNSHNIMQAIACAQWSENTFCLDLSTNEIQGGTIKEFQNFLQSSEGSEFLLVVIVSTLDEALNLITSQSRPIGHLSLLAPGSQLTAGYVKEWVNCKTFSLGYILSHPKPTTTDYYTLELSSSMLSSTTFSNIQVALVKKPPKLDSSTSLIRASYEHLIPPLKPEPRGCRVGFFTQVEYVLKGVGLTVGILCIAGLYYGLKTY